jgi:hypothetical protein
MTQSTATSLLTQTPSASVGASPVDGQSPEDTVTTSGMGVGFGEMCTTQQGHNYVPPSHTRGQRKLAPAPPQQAPAPLPNRMFGMMYSSPSPTTPPPHLPPHLQQQSQGQQGQQAQERRIPSGLSASPLPNHNIPPPQPSPASQSQQNIFTQPFMPPPPSSTLPSNDTVPTTSAFDPSISSPFDFGALGNYEPNVNVAWQPAPDFSQAGAVEGEMGFQPVGVGSGGGTGGTRSGEGGDGTGEGSMDVDMSFMPMVFQWDLADIWQGGFGGSGGAGPGFGR